MEKEEELGIICYILKDILKYWKGEANNEGSKFDFDSQDIYKQAYEDCISKYKLIEKYPPDYFKEDRKNIIENLREICEQIIVTYHRNKKLFRGLNRKALMLETYRKRNPSFYGLPDFNLEVYLYPETELPSRDDYYKSEFYNTYGFLLNDYHFEIYMFSKFLLDTYCRNYKEYDLFKTFIDHSDFVPYFSMRLISEVYSFCNGNFFDETSELEFYLSLNLMNVVSGVRVVKNENRRVFYVLYKFSTLIVDSEIRSYWLSKTLNRLSLDDKSYQSKYKDVVSKESREANKEFVEKIDSIFKSYS